MCGASLPVLQRTTILRCNIAHGYADGKANALPSSVNGKPAVAPLSQRKKKAADAAFLLPLHMPCR